jgi:hypothetical protein
MTASLTTANDILLQLCRDCGANPGGMVDGFKAGISADGLLSKLEAKLGVEFYTNAAGVDAFREMYHAAGENITRLFEADAHKACSTILQAAGLESEAFLNQLNAGKKPVSCTQFLEILEKAFGAEELTRSPVAPLSLRAIHLESNNPSKTFNSIRQMAVLKDTEAKPLQKLGAGLGAFINGRALAKEYTGIGIRKVAKNAIGFFINPKTDNTNKWLKWPSFGKPEQDIGERAMLVVDDLIAGLQKKRGNNTAIGNLARLVDLSEESIGGVIEAASNVMKDPEVRARICAKINASNNVSDAAKSAAGATLNGMGNFSSREVQLALNEVLGAVGKFHNPRDVKRISDLISITIEHNHIGENASVLESMAKFWQARTHDVATLTETVRETAAPVIQEAKIAFANRPSVNLGVGIASLAGVVYLKTQFAQPEKMQSETKNKDGSHTITIEEHRAPLWKRAIRSAAVVSLLSACGVAVFRAAAMPNAQGLSFIEKVTLGKTSVGPHLG